jgi:hypothetical protein
MKLTPISGCVYSVWVSFGALGLSLFGNLRGTQRMLSKLFKLSILSVSLLIFTGSIWSSEWSVTVHPASNNPDGWDVDVTVVLPAVEYDPDEGFITFGDRAYVTLPNSGAIFFTKPDPGFWGAVSAGTYDMTGEYDEFYGFVAELNIAEYNHNVYIIFYSDGEGGWDLALEAIYDGTTYCGVIGSWSGVPEYMPGEEPPTGGGGGDEPTDDREWEEGDVMPALKEIVDPEDGPDWDGLKDEWADVFQSFFPSVPSATGSESLSMTFYLDFPIPGWEPIPCEIGDSYIPTQAKTSWDTFRTILRSFALFLILWRFCSYVMTTIRQY